MADGRKAKLVGSGQTMVAVLQDCANELGHTPSRAEYEASEHVARMPLFRIISFFKSFEKAVAHVADPSRPAELTADAALDAVRTWAVSSCKLPSPSAWTQSLRTGLDLPKWADVEAATGMDREGLRDAAHAALIAAGYEPGKGGLSYRPAGRSREAARAHSAAASRVRPGVRERCEDDTIVRRELAEQARLRKEAGVHQGQFQTESDKAGAEAFGTLVL
jgi:hypothetical protein